MLRIFGGSAEIVYRHFFSLSVETFEGLLKIDHCGKPWSKDFGDRGSVLKGFIISLKVENTYK